MTAADILKLIETVDPSDTAKMDEIDILVGTYFGYDVRPASDGFGPLIKQDYYMVSLPSYSRSRDALKKIRPDGWRVYQLHKADLPDKWVFILTDKPHQFITGIADTEELAELYAIISAIEYERNKA